MSLSTNLKGAKFSLYKPKQRHAAREPRVPAKFRTTSIFKEIYAQVQQNDGRSTESTSLKSLSGFIGKGQIGSSVFTKMLQSASKHSSSASGWMKTFDSIKIALTAVRIQLTRDESDIQV